jgi:riboflavin kinase / FMN adenylyltransferase
MSSAGWATRDRQTPNRSTMISREVMILRDLEQLPDSWCHGALAIGNYDGVHVGHARIVQRLVELASRLEGPAVVFTFDPPPARVLHPEQAPALLTWTERKAELLARLGVDGVIAYPTDKAFLGLEPREFFDRIVRGRLASKAMVEGPDFFFGRRRAGNVQLLRQFCDDAGVALEVVDPVIVDGQPVSSSRIRGLLAAGGLNEAAGMLTAPYRIRGTVIHGAGRGAKLGFPTANLDRPDTLLPSDGIYAGRAFAEGKLWPAAISIGPNPTFAEGARKVEVYLIGYQGWLYGRVLEVDFLRRLRDTKRFESVDHLLAQMRQDVAESCRIADGAG